MSNSALAVTAITWIPRGSARQRPVRFELTSEDVSKLTAKAYVDDVIPVLCWKRNQAMTLVGMCVFHRKAAQDRERGEELAEAHNEEADEDDQEDDMDAEDDAEDEEAAADMKEDDDVELPPELDMDNYDNEKEIDLLDALDNDDDEDDDDMDADDEDMAGALEVRAGIGLGPLCGRFGVSN